MTLAFDIDDTWSLDPGGWLEVMELMQRRGHECIFVTGAQQPPEKLRRLGIPESAEIIVSGGQFKEHAARAAGYKVDVWIDDMPGMIQDCLILDTTKLDEPLPP